MISPLSCPLKPAVQSDSLALSHLIPKGLLNWFPLMHLPFSAEFLRPPSPCIRSAFPCWDFPEARRPNLLLFSAKGAYQHIPCISPVIPLASIVQSEFCSSTFRIKASCVGASLWPRFSLPCKSLSKWQRQEESKMEPKSIILLCACLSPKSCGPHSPRNYVLICYCSVRAVVVNSCFSSFDCWGQQDLTHLHISNVTMDRPRPLRLIAGCHFSKQAFLCSLYKTSTHMSSVVCFS